MGTSKVTYWVVGAAVLALAILGGGWALLIQPQMQSASSTRSETEQVEEQNRAEQEKVDALRAQFENIEVFEAQLAELQEQMPTQDLAIEFEEIVGQLALRYQVLLTASSTAGGQPVVPVDETGQPAPTVGAEEDDTAVEAADEAADETDEQTETTESVDQAPAPAPAVEGAIEGLTAIPVSVSVLGKAPAAREFANALQTVPKRLLLVETLTSVSQPVAAAAEGRPATVFGDVELTVTGYIFVFDDLRPVDDAEDPGTEEPTELAPLPLPGTLNPFAPTRQEE